MLAGMDGMIYKEQTLELQKGDILFLFTDGVTEAMDEAGELFTEKNLQAALEGTAGDADPEAMIGAVREAVSRHVGDAEASDDITMMGLVYHGTA